MGGLDDYRHAAQQNDLVAPVELVGFPRRKAQRNVGRRRRLSALLGPIRERWSSRTARVSPTKGCVSRPARSLFGSTFRGPTWPTSTYCARSRIAARSLPPPSARGVSWWLVQASSDSKPPRAPTRAQTTRAREAGADTSSVSRPTRAPARAAWAAVGRRRRFVLAESGWGRTLELGRSRRTMMRPPRRELGGGVRRHPGFNNCVEGLTASLALRSARPWRAMACEIDLQGARTAPAARAALRLLAAVAIGATMELGRSWRTLLLMMLLLRPPAARCEVRGHRQQAALKDQRFRGRVPPLYPLPRAHEGRAGMSAVDSATCWGRLGGAVAAGRRRSFVLVLHRALPDLQRMKLWYSAAASSAPRSVFSWCD